MCNRGLYLQYHSLGLVAELLIRDVSWFERRHPAPERDRLCDTRCKPVRGV